MDFVQGAGAQLVQRDFDHIGYSHLGSRPSCVQAAFSALICFAIGASGRPIDFLAGIVAMFAIFGAILEPVQLHAVLVGYRRLIAVRIVLGSVLYPRRRVWSSMEHPYRHTSVARRGFLVIFVPQG